jgi:pentafunctional AROM polypeptide
VHIKEESFFLCAFLDELIQNVNQLWTINKEYHALEIRLDKQKESLIETAYKCALVRYHVDIPIIFTLRTKEEGGFFEGNYMSQMK